MSAAASQGVVAVLRRAHDAYMFGTGYSGPDDRALHPRAAENWRRIRAALAPFKATQT